MMKVSYDELTDAELLELLPHRDELAFALIYERHWGVLYTHAYKIIQEEAASKDVVQEVFINLWNTTADSVGISGALKSYLFAAVRNRVLNLIRDRKVRNDYIGLFSLYIDEHRDTTLELLDEKELLYQIDQIVASFPARMQQIFQLSRAYYRSHKEIAEELGISESTVARQISNALLILRTKLDRKESYIIAALYVQQLWDR